MSLNKVMLIGNVGKDPVIRYVQDGVCTASFPLATTTPAYTLPSGTQVPERTEWHNILLWRHLAEQAERYVRKGDKLYIEGELRTRNYTDKQGITRYITEVWGREMFFSRPSNDGHPQSAPTVSQPNPVTPQSTPDAAPQPATSGSDLPF